MKIRFGLSLKSHRTAQLVRWPADRKRKIVRQKYLGLCPSALTEYAFNVLQLIRVIGFFDKNFGSLNKTTTRRLSVRPCDEVTNRHGERTDGRILLIPPRAGYAGQGREIRGNFLKFRRFLTVNFGFEEKSEKMTFAEEISVKSWEFRYEIVLYLISTWRKIIISLF